MLQIFGSLITDRKSVSSTSVLNSITARPCVICILLLLNINRKTYRGSPTGPLDLTLSDLDISHQPTWAGTGHTAFLLPVEVSALQTTVQWWGVVTVAVSLPDTTGTGHRAGAPVPPRSPATVHWIQ